MPISEKDFVDVAVHGQTTGSLVVIPFKIDSGKFGSLPVCRYLIEFLEGIEEVIGMLAACVLHSEVIHYQYECDWTPFVSP